MLQVDVEEPGVTLKILNYFKNPHKGLVLEVIQWGYFFFQWRLLKY